MSRPRSITYRTGLTRLAKCSIVLDRNAVFLYETQRIMVEEHTNNKAQILKSVDLALRVLESFRGGEPERGVTELAKQLGVSKATVYRTLATLERRNYVAQNPASGRYQLGPVLRQLGQVAQARVNLPIEALPYMERLRDRTGEAVHLAVLDAGEAVYIAKVAGLKPIQVVSGIGTRCPAHCVSTGKALLAYADPGYVQKLIVGGLTRYTARTHASPNSLDEELAKIRERRYAINLGEWREEVGGVAAPVVNGNQQVMAAIGVCGPRTRLEEGNMESIVTAVSEVADSLSEHLGASDYTSSLSGAEQSDDQNNVLEHVSATDEDGGRG